MVEAAVTTPPPAAATPPPVGTPTSPDFNSTIPTEYQGKEYMKGIDSSEKLFKAFDGAQTLIGTRPAGIPQDNASEEDWGKYYDSAGRPEKSDGYEFKRDEKLAAALKTDEKFEGAVKDLFHKAGVSKKQSAVLQQGYDALLMGVLQGQTEAAAKADEEFANLAETTFGKDVDKVMETSKGLIDQFIPENMKPHLDKLDNNSLVILAGVLKGVSAKYIKEDAVPPAGGPPSALGGADKHARGRELMASEPYRNAFHKDHADVVRQVRELYSTIDK